MDKIRKYEIFIVCVLSGIGMIYSGHILDAWKNYNFISADDQLWIMITPLLGLKGNLEMTLASRLSTRAKIRGMEDPLKIGYDNLVLIQIQGILVGFGASFLVTVITIISTTDDWITLLNEFIRLAFIGIFTASTACVILGTLTISIVYCSWKLNFDPDNIATPLAAALGDTVTLFILHFFANLCQFRGGINYLQSIALVFMFLIILPMLLTKLSSNEGIHILRPCLCTVFPAMVLSSFSGWILKIFIFRVQFLATFQPLINGVGGNVAAILCSSLSTNYHKLKADDDYNESDLKKSCQNLQQFLVVITITTHIVLLFAVYSWGLIALVSIAQIVVPYFCAVLIQTTILLYAAKYLVMFLWQRGVDPDNCSIPIATAFGDILGTSLLCLFLMKSM